MLRLLSLKSMLSSPALLRIQWLPKRAVRSPKCVWLYAKCVRPPPAQHPIEKPRAYDHSFAKEVMPSLDKMQLEESDHGAPCVSKLGATCNDAALVLCAATATDPSFLCTVSQCVARAPDVMKAKDAFLFEQAPHAHKQRG